MNNKKKQERIIVISGILVMAVILTVIFTVLYRWILKNIEESPTSAHLEQTVE